jgi:hypothetical protein
MPRRARWRPGYHVTLRVVLAPALVHDFADRERYKY